MKKHTMAIGSLVLLGLLVGLGPAQEGGREGREGRRARRRGRGRDRAGRGRERMERLREELNLSGDKWAQVEEILKTHRQAMRNWQREHREERRALRREITEARREGKKEALRRLQGKQRKLLAGQRENRQELLKRLDEVLNDDQMAIAKKILQPGRGRRRTLAPGLQALRRVNLTPEQSAQVREILARAMKRIKHDVLTDRQRRQLEELLEEKPQRRRGPGRQQERHRGNRRGGGRRRGREGDL